MISIVVYVLTNMFRLYLTYKFIKTFLGKTEKNKQKQFMAYAVFYIVNTFLYLNLHLAWVNVFSNIIGCLIVIYYLYNVSIRQNCFVTVIIYIVSMLCDIIATVPFTIYQDGQKLSSVYSIISTLLILFCALLAEKIVHARKKENMQFSLSLILVPVSSILIICYIAYSDVTLDKDVVVVSLGLLWINFLVIYLYNVVLEITSKRYENEILSQKVQFYANQLEVIQQTEQKIRVLQHDLKHHVNELKLMAVRNQNIQIQEYISGMEEYLQSPNEVVSSGNKEVDSLLNYFLRQAKKKLKEVNVDVRLPDDMLHSFDLNIIIGNLLENAIEAAERTEERFLNVNIVFNKGILKVDIENSYSHALKKSKEGFQTTKLHKEKHGIGLKSVEKIVEKYNGIMEIETNRTFHIILILYMHQ